MSYQGWNNYQDWASNDFANKVQVADDMTFMTPSTDGAAVPQQSTSFISDGLGSLYDNTFGSKGLDLGSFFGSGAKATDTKTPAGGGFGNAIGLGQLVLGALEYKDRKKMNNATLDGMRFNLAQGKKEAAVDDAYRKSYGA
jgi:hypothetical protein